MRVTLLEKSSRFLKRMNRMMAEKRQISEL